MGLLSVNHASKLVCLSNQAKLTGNRKDTSLPQNVSIFCKLQIEASVFVQYSESDWQQKIHWLTTKYFFCKLCKSGKFDWQLKRH